MKNKKRIVALLVVIAIVVCQFIPLHKSISHDEYIDKTEYIDNDSATRYFLKYAMGATGVNWYVQGCSDKTMIGEQVMVKTFVDPRFLNINKNYELDKNGTLIVESVRKERMTLDTQSVWRIYPQKIYIYLPDISDATNNYYFRHISLSGYVKMIGSIFYPLWRYSY